MEKCRGLLVCMACVSCICYCLEVLILRLHRIFGLCNNFGYVIMLSAAHDILSDGSVSLYICCLSV